MPGQIIPIGVGTAAPYPRQLASGVGPNRFIDPGNTNPPIIFEPPEALSGGSLEIFMIASGGTNWGGCQVWVSTEGDTYAIAGTIYKGARQGVLTAPLPSHADPDITDILSIDLGEDGGQLLSGTQADADSFVTLCFCDGELISYETATLTGPSLYNLNYLRRGVYGTPINTHTVGSNFARFGPNDPSLFRYTYPASFIGKTISIKLPAFNVYGQAAQSLADIDASSYTLTGNGSVVPTNVSVWFLSMAIVAGRTITRYTFGEAVNFPANFVGSHVTAGIGATATVIFDIAKNMTNFGTLTFATGALNGVLASSVSSFISGDVLTIAARTSDPTLLNISGLLAGTSGT